MKQFLFSSVATAIFAFSGTAMAANFVAGKDYTVVANPGKFKFRGKLKSVNSLVWLPTLLLN
jgi:thiol:disulfide interchange protein DsbA